VGPLRTTARAPSKVCGEPGNCDTEEPPTLARGAVLAGGREAASLFGKDARRALALALRGARVAGRAVDLGRALARLALAVAAAGGRVRCALDGLFAVEVRVGVLGDARTDAVGGSA
jgi:hypothetical protein